MKKEKRYYQIRIDYFWLSILAVIIVISIIIAYYASAHEQTSSQPVSTKHRADIDVTFDDLRSSLENTSECYLCGNAEESLMSYFRNFDTIGLISLNDWFSTEKLRWKWKWGRKCYFNFIPFWEYRWNILFFRRNSNPWHDLFHYKLHKNGNWLDKNYLHVRW